MGWGLLQPLMTTPRHILNHELYPKMVEQKIQFTGIQMDFNTCFQDGGENAVRWRCDILERNRPLANSAVAKLVRLVRGMDRSFDSRLVEIADEGIRVRSCVTIVGDVVNAEAGSAVIKVVECGTEGGATEGARVIDGGIDKSRCVWVLDGAVELAFAQLAVVLTFRITGDADLAFGWVLELLHYFCETTFFVGAGKCFEDIGGYAEDRFLLV